jgi:hypothetical protein
MTKGRQMALSETADPPKMAATVNPLLIKENYLAELFLLSAKEAI